MKKGLIAFAVILILMLWKTGHLAYTVVKEKNQWEQQGATLAKQDAGVVKVDDVSLYHGDQRYLVAQGENADGSKLIAWFREDGTRVGREYVQDVASQEEIEEKLQAKNGNVQVIRFQPGIDRQIPVWETVWLDGDGKYNYTYYDMKTGHFIRSFRLQNMGM